jgi:hypothetical protein
VGYSEASGMIAYLVTDCAFGTGSGHYVAIDLHMNIEAALMLSDRLWGSTNLLSNGYLGLFPRV